MTPVPPESPEPPAGEPGPDTDGRSPHGGEANPRASATPASDTHAQDWAASFEPGLRINPADPHLSAEPGREKKRLLVPLSITLGLILALTVLWIAAPRGPRPPFLTFESRDLGCRFEYSSRLRAGPNFVKSGSGSILTVERFDLFDAKKDWVAQLPDVLFPQVLIQINENYAGVRELSRTPVTMDGRKGLEVVLEGRPGGRPPDTKVTIVIAATDDYVYVLRSYSPEGRDAEERPLFRHVRETWKFLKEPR